ncbi:MAG TPA: type III-B CRISPR module RAMP protein Cmr1 [Desulfobacterales bacterium]|nr:MAG: type III-B CRISPR module RAMP protein Cmr1 [Deltaproteobacteria bacterium]HDG98390.1 type III-B CRISPR module RAMP protein Cmr1 [Desulfobacterales bacterium]
MSRIELDKSLLKKRFGDIVDLKLTCEIITPMFLGDAFQNASLRPEPFKALLRYWWRVAAGDQFTTPRDLLEEEGKLFGSGSDNAHKSLIKVAVEGNVFPENGPLPKMGLVYHPEVGRKIHPLLYLGYGPIIWDRSTRRAVYQRPYLPPGKTFVLKIMGPKDLFEHNTHFKKALLYIRAFGTVGSRCRNGWGSFQIVQKEYSGNLSMIAISKLALPSYGVKTFQKDYPYSLALSPQNQLLLWRTDETSSWTDVMLQLAEIYIKIRHKLPANGPNDVDERHLLGFPLTNHYAHSAPNWGRVARHASPIRFIVRKKQKNYYGFVLHVPFGISKKMRKNAQRQMFFTESKQKQIWDKVHEILDQYMKRARLDECL